MESKDRFLESIKEVETINNNIDDKKEDSITYFKAIILFLCTKLEKYTTDSAKEYIIEIKNKRIVSSKIPTELKRCIVQNEIDKINKYGLYHFFEKEEYKKHAENISLMWDDNYVLSSINEDEFYIELSSHGTNVINDLYKKIGFDSLISEVDNYDVEMAIAGVTSVMSYTVSNEINRIVGMRNNIIHEDATPNVTKQDIDLFISISKHFVLWIDNFLSEKVQLVTQNS